MDLHSTAATRATYFTDWALALLGAFAQYYSDNLSQETLKGLRERARQGLYVGPLPFGYQKGTNGIPEVFAEEGAIVRRAFEMYASGRYTFQAIATWLNTTSFKPRVHRRDRKGREHLWSKDTVKDMVQNPFYIGVVKYRGELMPGKHRVLVGHELFNHAQQVRREHRKGPWTYTPRHRTYL